MALNINPLYEYSKNYLVEIISSVGDGIITTNSEGRIEFVNNMACEILEKPFERLYGNILDDVFRFFNDDLLKPIRLLDLKLDNDSVNTGLSKNTYILTSSGKKKYISAQLSNVKSSNIENNGFVLVFRDISQIIESEKRILHEKDNIYQMFKELPIGMIIIDTDLKITDANQYFINTFNLNYDTVINHAFGEAFLCVWSFEKGCGNSKHCLFCKFKNEVTKMILNKDTVKDFLVEINHLSNGVEKSSWLNIGCMPKHQDRKTYYLITIEDFTERINYETYLEEARKSSLSILDSLPVMIFRMNKVNKCDFINETFKNQINIRESSFLIDIKNHMEAESFAEFSKNISISHTQKIPFNFEVQLITSEQNSRYMLCVGKPLYNSNNDFMGIIGIFLDIHDKKTSELLYRQSQSKYYSLFQNLDNSILYFNMIYDVSNNLEDAMIIEMNFASKVLFNTKFDQSIGKKLSESPILSSQEKNDLLSHFNTVLKTGESLHFDSFYLSSLDKWIQVSVYSPEKDYIVMLISDIDYKKKAQLELLMEKEHSEEANRAKSEFLANMSHEIRTPLNGIVGMIDLSLLDPLSEEQTDNLNTAKECVSSLIDIINDVLDFSKIEAGKLRLENREFDLIDLLESTIKVHLPHINEKSLNLVTDFEQVNAPKLIGDSKRIKQVLNNLINNAIKFTDQGQITVQAVQSKEMDDTQNCNVVVTISDTGVGIPESKKALLFNSFTQIDGSYTRKYGGTGLGLVISKQLVEMMHGTIGFVSSESKGSNFHFSLPLVISSSHLGDKSDKVIEKSNMTNKRILLVEDDKVNQIVIMKMLESDGFSVVIANNGIEAISLIDINQFDLVLMDIQMPEMDGIEATRQIRAGSSTNKKVPIIALTAFALKGDEDIFRASGMDDYISKPVDRIQLIGILNQHFENKSLIKTGDVYLTGETSNLLKEHISYTEDITTLKNLEVLDELKIKIKHLRIALEQENYILLEISAHQLKLKFEQLRAEELKNIAFKIELEIRKERFENVHNLLSQIENIISILYDAT